MEIKVNKDEKLIKFLIHNIQGMSFGNAQKLLRLGKVKVNGKRCKDNVSLNPKDTVEILVFNKSMPKVEIIYKDDNILIVNKPQGIECATRDKSSENTYSLEEIFEKENAIVIHRLDRLTEGLVILARNKDIAKEFENIFRNREVEKFYQACVFGSLNDEGIKTAYLKKDSTKALVEISDTQKEGFKEIITEYNIIKNYDNYTHVNIKLHTGRTHQIRGYFSHIEHAIIGDNKYSDKENILTSEYKGYFLTAYKLLFNIKSEKLKYLNELKFEISPTWLQYLK